MDKEVLKQVLEDHKAWVLGEGGKRADLSGAVLRWAVLHGADLSGADLRGADLRWAVLHGANLRWADLRGADLSRADLREAGLHGAFLNGADLHGADLHGADLHGAFLIAADLRGADWGETKIIQLGPLGSRKDYLVVKRFKDGSTEAKTGCFHGSLEEFAAAVEQTHKDNEEVLHQYQKAIEYLKGELGVYLYL